MDRAEFERLHSIEDALWWYRGRRDAIDDLLATRRIDAPGLVLDLGCGTGRNVEHFSARWRVVGAEPSRDALRICRRKGLARLVRCSGARLPFKPGAFDLVFALDVVEHIPDERGALREIARVGRRAVLTVPAHGVLFGSHDRAVGHARRYGRLQFERRLRDAFGKAPEVGYLFGVLFPLMAIGTVWRNIFAPTGPSVTEPMSQTPEWLNRFLEGVMAVERRWLRRSRLPVGMTLVAITTPR